MKETFFEQMREELEFVSIHLTEEQLWKCFRYFELLVEKNQVMNLTAITEEKEVVTKHIVDSLSAVRVLPNLYDKKGLRILDVGTGAGFPGIPLKIAFPNCHITLLDSLKKRINFLQEICSQLELNDIYAIHGRAEDFGHIKKYREQFDVCVSRAVANLSTLSEYCLPFIKTGGLFISYKSGDVEEEVEAAGNAIKQLGGSIQTIDSFQLSGTAISRSFVVIKKQKSTPGKYPRRSGLPSKDPLR